MSVRVYVPLTPAGLAALVAEGRLDGPQPAHAVTSALRAEWPDSDEESWEYAALMAAAEVSALLREPGDRPRRIVVAADAPSCEPLEGDDPTAVLVTAGIAWANIAAVHVDTADDADPEDDLAWYATQEIPDLL